VKVSTSKSKSKSSKSKSTGKFPSASQLAGQYKADARRAQASARRETADAQHRTKEAQHYEQEAKKAQKEGYAAQAKYDLAKARRETAEARRDQAKARKNEVKAKLDKAKAARAKAGLLSPGAIPDRWILGGNDWHNGCAAVALANHLYATTGIRVSDEDVLGLYWLTADDPDEGAGVAATLEVAAEFGLAGMRPGFSLCGVPAAAGEFVGLPDILIHAGIADAARAFQEPCGQRMGEGTGHAINASPVQDHVLPERSAVDLLPDLAGALTGGKERAEAVHTDRRGHGASILLDFRLQQAQRHQPVWDWEPSPDWGAHAGVLAGGSVITWGREIPVTAEFLARQVVGAWRVDWVSP